MSIKIRAEEPGDVDMIRLLNDQAFKKMQHSNGNESAIVDSLRERGALTLSLVATMDNEVVGHVAYSPVTIDDKDEGWFGLGPVAVRPSKQGSGIGSALIRAGLDHLRTANARGCVVLGDPAYYQRFGFNPRSALCLPGVPATHFMALSFNGVMPAGTVAYDAVFSVS